MNYVLMLGVLAGLGWLFVEGAQQLLAPTTSSAPRSVAPETSVTSFAASDRNMILEARRAPVPLVRNLRALPLVVSIPDFAAADSEERVQDVLNKKAAKAAIEADGYKQASVLGKSTDGSWRAKAYRGSTEVQLTVDGTGRLTLE